MPLHRHHDAIRSDFPFRSQKYYIFLNCATFSFFSSQNLHISHKIRTFVVSFRLLTVY